MSSPGLRAPHVDASEPRDVCANRSPDIAIPKVEASSTTREIIAWMIRSATNRLIANEEAVRLRVDLEGVHRSRVATRWLRSDLRTFGSVLEPEWCRGLRRDLRWFGRKLGDVRDLDVLDDRIREHAALLPDDDASGVAAVLEPLQVLREVSRKELLSAMHEPRHARLLRSLEDAAAHPRVLGVTDRPARDVLGAAMEAPWFHLKRACDSLDPRSLDAELHEARIRAKRARYAAEVLVPVFGKPARRFARRAEAMQEVLGRHQDAVMAIAWLRSRTAETPGVGFAAGMLAGAEASVRDEARHAWPSVWAELRRKRLRFWE